MESVRIVFRQGKTRRMKLPKYVILSIDKVVLQVYNKKS